MEEQKPQSFGDAVTLILGSAKDLEEIRMQKPLAPFSEEVMGFLASLSERIRKDRACDQMPEAAAFAFWCRPAHLRKLRGEYDFSKQRRLGRGVSLHFAPSNMPALFAFSMAAGLLAGNSVIVRLPGKETAQERLLVSHLGKLLLEEALQLQGRIVLCRYPHDRGITDGLSSLCDVRLIWGSDASVSEIRRSPLPPQAIDLPFASRGSAALLDAEAVLKTADPAALARDFYNDTYLNDQNACSSPRIVYWLGPPEKTREARERFWGAVLKVLEQKDYQVPAAVAVQKLERALLLTAEFKGVKILQEPNRLMRVSVPVLQRGMWGYTAPGGFFIESGGETTEAMMDILDGHCQTLCTYGIDREKLAQELMERRIEGVDRIVPAGHGLDFTLTWDGFDLITCMSRRIRYE